MLVRYGIHPVHKQAHIAFRISKKKSNELEFTGAGVPTLSVQGIIKHVIGPVNAGAGAPPLCLQAYFIEGEGENLYNHSAEDRHLLTLIRQSLDNVNPMIQNLKQHISQLQTYNDIPRYRIVLGEKTPEGQNPQLYLLPTLRELSVIIIDPDINIDIKYHNSKREIVLESHGHF